MGSYMSSSHPKKDWSILHAEVIKLGEDFEVEFDDNEAGLEFYSRCAKSPEHTNMIPMSRFSMEDLPAPWRTVSMYNFVTRNARQTVKIIVSSVSPHRPAKYCLGRFRGQRVASVGTGFSEITSDLLTEPPILCPLKNCSLPQPHRVCPIFTVNTARHVVFDDSEAENTSVEYFYDSDGAVTVKCQVLKVAYSHSEQDRSKLYCVCHDLNLFQKIEEAHQLPESPAPLPLGPRNPLVLIISHPHGCYKHVSFGDWVGSAKNPSNVDLVKSRKLRDMLRIIQQVSPQWRQTGFTSNGNYWEPRYILEMEYCVKKHPEITMAEWRQQESEISVDLSFPFITYTAATCPGSSGANVNVVFEGECGYLACGLMATHFRQFSRRKVKDKFVNASGIVATHAQYQDQVKGILGTLKTYDKW